MPQGTAVDRVYQALLKKGYSKEKAARIAQSQTGEALATGRRPKHAICRRERRARLARSGDPPGSPPSP